MEGEVIFYIAGKTAANSVQLKKSLSDVNVMITNVNFATDVKKFIRLLTTAVSRSKLIFIVGGLTDFSDNNVITVLSKALGIKLKDGSLPLLEGVQTLENSWGANGSFLESGKQSICVLPDEPEQINIIMNNQLKSILSKKYSLPIESCIMPPERFLKNIDSNIMMALNSKSQNNQPSLSIEDIKNILPEDISRELFGDINQEASYNKSNESDIPASNNLDTSNIFENTNRSSNETQTSVSSSDIIHQFPCHDMEPEKSFPRHAAPEKEDPNNVEPSPVPTKQSPIINNTNPFKKTTSIFEDPDVELSNVDLNAEAENRAKIKLNNQAKNIVLSQTEDPNNSNSSFLDQENPQKDNSENLEKTKSSEQLFDSSKLDSKTSPDQKAAHSFDLDKDNVDNDKILEEHSDKESLEDQPDKELLLQSIEKSKTSTLMDILLVILILAAIGCSVYIYYKVFWG